MTHAIIYWRWSPRPDAEETESAEKQLETCREYCSRQGYDVIGEYGDPGKSGDDPDRIGLWDAVEALRKGMVLVCRWRSRLARDVFLSEVINKAVGKAGAKTEAAEEGNGDSPQDVLIRDILAAMARYERKVIALRTKYAMLRYQNRDRRIMSKRLPYGYRPDPGNDGKMMDCLVEQETLRVMETLAGDGMSFRRIAQELDLMGYPPREAEAWSHKTVAKILRRRGVAG